MKICLFTSQFPNYDNPGVTYATPFLYNYAKEWVKEGNEVTIIHMIRSYPKGFNFLAKTLAKFGNHKFEKYIISPNAQVESDYMYNGIHIYRIVFKKYVPHGSSSDGQIRKLTKKIDCFIKEYNIEPDIIIGDFFDPALKVIQNLSDRFNCPIGQTLHVTDYNMLQDNKYNKISKQVQFWMLRTESQEELLKNAGILAPTYMMYSGITDRYVEKTPVFRKQIKNLVFVGMINKFKGIDTVLEALSNLKESGITLKLIGKGTDIDYFKKRVKELGLEEIVEFIGQVSHEEVFEYMNIADAQIMISHETFGMVYVEAMSQGCIPIGAREEGIDGVVKDGVNGFLSPLGDAKALEKKLENLMTLQERDVSKISEMAYKTAVEMTDKKLANTVIKYFQQISENKLLKE